MILILDGAYDAQFEAIRNAYLASNDVEVVVHEDYPASIEEVVNNKDTLQIYTSYPKTTGDSGEDRYQALYLASQGLRYWGSKLDTRHPVYAGQLPMTAEEIDRLVIDANYAEARFDLIEGFGVQFTGNTYSAPRIFAVLDTKRKVNWHRPADNPKVGNFLASLPDDIWPHTALISTSSAKRLEEILTENDQTIPVTTSTATSAKLKFAGLCHIESYLPSEYSKEFGISLRASVTLFERQ